MMCFRRATPQPHRWVDVEARLDEDGGAKESGAVWDQNTRCKS